MVAAFAGLCQCLFEEFIRHAFNLDVHLAARDAFFSTREFEVHISQGILVAKDIREDGRAGAVGDQAHGDTGYGGFEFDAAVHHCH